MTVTPSAKWKVKSTCLVFDHQWTKVRQDVVELPNGVILDDYFYCEGGDFVQVFALTREQEVILVRQYKHGVRDIILELPAGMRIYRVFSNHFRAEDIKEHKLTYLAMRRSLRQYLISSQLKNIRSIVISLVNPMSPVKAFYKEISDT